MELLSIHPGWAFAYAIAAVLLIAGMIMLLVRQIDLPPLEDDKDL